MSFCRRWKAFWLGPKRQRAQIDASREHVIDQTVNRLHRAIKNNKEQNDIFENVICELRSVQEKRGHAPHC